MWKWLFLVLIFWWLARLAGRALGRLFLGPRSRSGPPAGDSAASDQKLKDLTQQEISDADYEEIP